MNFFSWQTFFDIFPRILAKIPVTLGLTVGSFALGTVLALVITAIQVYRVPVARQIALVYVSFMRGTPILIQLLICNLALPGVIRSLTGINVGRLWPPLVFVIIAYALNTAAFLSETLRASITGVERGQHEAASACGLTELQSLRYVVLPQALRTALPGIANMLSSLLKDTSLAYSAAGILDVMGIVSALRASTFRELEGYVVAAIIFFGLCLLLERVFHLLAKRLDVGVASTEGG
jgi:L-cystine transport system permease protein